MTVTWLPAATDRTRLGVTVSKKVGNSPIRSLVKRWIREVFRTHKDRWPEMVDFVVIARPSVVRGGLDGVRKDMLRWADKLARAKPPADEQ
ncbi:MAG: ribonuclease P protein component [Bradymonadia bacterium]|jgi:ribonuclease P protein component